MNGVLGMLTLLRDVCPEPQQIELIDDTEECSQHLMHIIDDILDFSKIEANAVSLESVDFDIRQLIDNCLAVIAFKAQMAVKLSAHIDSRVPERLNSDLHRIKQILLNLLSNAAKFTERGSIQVFVKLDHLHGQTHAQLGLKWPTPASASPRTKSTSSSRSSPRPIPVRPANMVARGLD